MSNRPGKSYKKLFSTACEAPIEAHKDNFDLHHWVFNLSDSDYQNTARGHIAAGASTHIDGTRTSVNVESVGGNLLVQHYVAEVGEKDYVRMVSYSDLWLMKLIHVVVKVTWEMRLIHVSENQCAFRNTVTVEHPSFLMQLCLRWRSVAFLSENTMRRKRPYLRETWLSVRQRGGVRLSLRSHLWLRGMFLRGGSNKTIKTRSVRLLRTIGCSQSLF
jgi:hypothetical protein